jgi:hypothetical protein
VINYFPSFDSFGVTLLYNNTAFIDAFSGGLLSFVVNLDPNDKLRSTITPAWPKWSRAAEAEMVFNKTEQDAPHIALANTSSALLKRCEYVSRWNCIDIQWLSLPQILEEHASSCRAVDKMFGRKRHFI